MAGMGARQALSPIAHIEESFEASLVGPPEMHGNRAAGFAVSVVLHGLALLLLLVVMGHGANGSRNGLQLVPIEVVAIGEGTAAPGHEQPAAMSQPSAAQPPPMSTAGIDAARPERQPPADPLETKLQALAQLRQPDTDTRIVENDASESNRSVADDAAAAGGRGVLSLRELIRAQVERRWNLDVTALGNNSYSVPIHVEMTSAGVVIKAEIVNTRPADPVYHDIAVSARNAVLMSSPLSLPAGHYQGVIDMILDLNPKDTLH
jgi:hypothetical protein